ncbi:MAG: M1 family peptidase [bacterium]|nr:M1 family peptidase [bacterium]
MIRRLALLLALLATPAAAAPRIDVQADVDPAARRIEGTVRLTATGPAPTRLTIPAAVSVDAVTRDGAVLDVEPAAGATLTIPVPAGTHSLVVRYRTALGTLKGADGDAPVAGPTDAYLPPGTWHPLPDAPFAWRLSATVPAPLRAVAPGRLDDHATRDGRDATVFTSEHPGDDLALFVGPYVVAARRHGAIVLRTWLHPEVAGVADTYLAKVAGYLDLYGGWIGSYPYRRFDVVSGPLPLGLGFPGLTYLGVRVIGLPFIPDTSLGHEVLHAWWGNGVRVGDGGNWAEGLTTFMADYTFVERQGAAAARDLRLRWLRELAILPAADDRPLRDFRGRRHTASQATGYHKAAFVFAMLRDTIGADAFADGIRRFWTVHRFGAATWHDLAAAFGAAAGMPLGDFFAQWVDRPGAPTLAARDVRRTPDGVALTLGQTPPPYALGVPLAVETDTGAASRLARVDGEHTPVAIPTAASARRVVLDPALRLYRHLPADAVPPVLRAVAFDPAAAAVVVGDATARDAAVAVARALLEREASPVATLPAGPALLVGDTAAITRTLAVAGLPPIPKEVAGRGSARAFTLRRANGAPLAVVAGDDAAALAAAARVLPHLGAQSWVVLDGGRSTDRGVWPAGDGSPAVAVP